MIIDNILKSENPTSVKKFVVNFTSVVSSLTTIVSGDAWIKANYNNPKLKIFYMFEGTISTGSTVYAINFQQNNTPMWIRTSDSWNCYGQGIRNTASGTSNIYANNNLYTLNASDYGSIVVNSNGDLKINAGGGINLAIGKYIIVASIS